MKEYEVELEGATYICRSRERESAAPGALLKEYSFDGGKVWHLGMLEAYEDAKEKGRLVRSGDAQQDGDGLAVFVISLMNEIKTLKSGEGMKINREMDTLMVVREQTVLITRFSDIGDDVDLHLREARDGEDGQGRAGL